jgi:hypothetical protein
MFQSILRLVVHAVFGIGVLTAFTSFQPAEAGKIGGAIAKFGVRAAVGTAAGSARAKQRDRNNVDESTAEATEESKAPKVLNRWDMQRRQEPKSEAQSTAGAAADAATSAAAATDTPGGPAPVVVTIPTDQALQSAAASAPALLNSQASPSCGPGESCVVCVAGCPETRGQIMYRQSQIARKD